MKRWGHVPFLPGPPPPPILVSMRHDSPAHALSFTQLSGTSFVKLINKKNELKFEKLWRFLGGGKRCLAIMSVLVAMNFYRQRQGTVKCLEFQ